MAGQESHAHSSDQTSDHRRFNKGNGRRGVGGAGGERGGGYFPVNPASTGSVMPVMFRPDSSTR